MTDVTMTEDQLVGGLLEAFELSGWWAWHARRSDKALWMGRKGWPDITAIPAGSPGPMLVIEAKGTNGRVTEDQALWLVGLAQRGITAAVIRPKDYDRAIALILAKTSDAEAWAWAFRP